MDIVLIAIGWWLSGFAPALIVGIRFDGQATVGDLCLAALGGLLGPVMAMFAFIAWVKDSDVANRVVWRR